MHACETCHLDNEQEAHGAYQADLSGTGEEAQAQPEKLCGQRSLGVPGGPGSLKREGKPYCCPGDVQGGR